MQRIAQKLQNTATKSTAEPRRFTLVRHNSTNNIMTSSSSSSSTPSYSSSSYSKSSNNNNNNRSRIVRSSSMNRDHLPMSRSVQYRRQCGYAQPGAGEVLMIKRALCPPKQRRYALRWWNFRPTPSRLSNMSTA